MKTNSCLICMDESKTVVFSCATKKCPYEMCADCVKLAFQDSSGSNARECPSCKTPIARRLVESVCGLGAVKEVERELHARVEFEVTKRVTEELQQRKDQAKEATARARVLYQRLADELNMKCPRCNSVFHDYDGCNALTCWNSQCSAAICAICLEDCGSDAHDHVQRVHGDLFNKQAFENAKEKRERSTVASFLVSIEDESFETQELVKSAYEKASNKAHGGTANKAALAQGKVTAFLERARRSLYKAVRDDRKSLLSCDDEAYRRRGISHADLSPRNCIPEEYQLTLQRKPSGIYRIVLKEQDNLGMWREIPLPQELEANDKPRPGNKLKVDALSNLRNSLRCAVIAFQGCRHLCQTSHSRPPKGVKQLGDDEVSLVIRSIDAAGEVQETVLHENVMDRNKGCPIILGLNPNRRLLLLEQHVQHTEADIMMFAALKAYISGTEPKRLLGEIPVTPPASFEALNPTQKSVAHPLSLRTAMEVAGPPGTGKTKTITELARGVLDCTDLDIIILSERNGAIDAIASKIAGDCIAGTAKSPRVKDVGLWSAVVAFGSKGSIGESTKHFTADQKMKYHPELLDLRDSVSRKTEDIRKIGKQMMKSLGRCILKLEGSLPEGAEPSRRIRLIESGTEAEISPSRPAAIIDLLESTISAIGSLSASCEIAALVAAHSSILGHLIPVKDDEKNDSAAESRQWIRALKNILVSLKLLLKEPEFSSEKVEKAEFAKKMAEANLKATEARIRREMVSKARLMLCTIGSSHQLRVNPLNDADLVGGFNILRVSEATKRTVVVFDESGCIPSYEFLGLSRLGRIIECIVCVGDKHQLPPYSPSSDRRPARRQGYNGRIRMQQQQMAQTENVASLLDASNLDVDNGSKVILTTQYRVPRDIANLLNVHIYKGDYHTADICNAPRFGFQLVHVPPLPPPAQCRYGVRRGGGGDDARNKYINYAEIDRCCEIVRELSMRGDTSIMILTPYKKQQRQIQFILKRDGIDSSGKYPVLTIDQCQGQEADYVILSLVQKPTRFLNRQRLNVALSRVRQRLFLLVDRAAFRQACLDDQWECHRLANDLLHLPPPMDVKHYDEDDFVYESD